MQFLRSFRFFIAVFAIFMRVSRGFFVVFRVFTAVGTLQDFVDIKSTWKNL
jgi:hypothetical protein